MTGLVLPESATLNPFPGLRSFTSQETHLFFGRDGQSDELVRKLYLNRFVAITGDSGSGKSSLVRAGLIPWLNSGYMVRAGSQWRIIEFRPRSSPIENLLHALNREGLALDSDPETMRSDPRNLVDVARAYIGEKRLNLLILVDQFEELFRFKAARESAMADRDEKDGFVHILLEAAAQREVPIYVAITLRSDFLGDCSQFRGLPERINDSQYLVPRLTREQQRMAIEGPIHVAGGRIKPRLVQRFLNEASDDPDQLPVLQHALMRTWDYWHDQNKLEKPIDFEEYEAIGTLQHAISLHAEEAYREAVGLDVFRNSGPQANARGPNIVKRLFQRVSDKDQYGREIRRPTSIRELRAVCEAEFPEIVAVLNCFRKEGRSFLTPFVSDVPNDDLNDGTEIDVTHECLLRQWDRLRDEWTREEEDSRRVYMRIAERATDALVQTETSITPSFSSTEFLRGPLLARSIEWWEQRRPNRIWAERYHPAFDLAKEFLARSRAMDEAAKKAEEDARRAAAEEALRVEAERIRRTAEEEARKAEQEAQLNVLRARQKAQETEEMTRRRRSIAYSIASALLVVAGAVSFLYRQTAYQRNVVTARHLAVEADLIQNEQASSVETSTLLAVESMLREPLFENEQALRRSLSILRKPVSILGHSRASSVIFSPDGHWLATSSNDTARVFATGSGKEVAHLVHQGPVVAIAFSPDSHSVATGSYDNTARVFEAASGNEISRVTHQGPVLAVAFSPNGQWVATGSLDHSARVFEAATGKEIAHVTHKAPVFAVAFSPDSGWVATGSRDNTAKVFETLGGKEIVRLPHNGWVNAVAFSPQGGWIATGSDDNSARVFTVIGGKELSQLAHQGPVLSVSFSPDGRLVGTASDDRTARVFDAANGNELARLTHQDRVGAVAFSPDGRWLATGSYDHTARVFEALTGLEKGRLPQQHAVRAIAFSPNGQLIAAGGDDATQIFEATGRNETGLLTHSDLISAVAFSPDGQRVLTGGGDNNLHIFEAGTGKEILRLPHGELLSAVFSTDGKWIATSSGRTVNVLESVSGKAAMNSLILNDAVVCIALSPDRHLLAIGTGDEARIFEIPSRHELIAPLKHEGPVRAIAFSSDGRLATGSGDGIARIFELATGKEVTRWQQNGPISAIAFSPDGSRLATGSEDRTARVFEAANGKEIVREFHDGVVREVLFSPDDRLLATSSDDKSTRVFELPRGEELARINAPETAQALAFVENGRKLQTAVAGLGMLWIQEHSLHANDLISEACSSLSRNLTKSEWEKYFGSEPYRKTCPTLP